MNSQPDDLGMDHKDDLDAVAEACIEAHAVIERNGTPEMRAAIRTLLHIVGREIGRRNPSLRPDGQSDDHGPSHWSIR